MFICFFFAGNSLIIIVLSKDNSSSSTNTILRSLAICDIISLSLTIIYNYSRNYIYYFTESSTYDVETAKTLAYMIIHFTLPFSLSAIYGSHVITVMVTIDRYIAVCKPTVIRRKRQVYITLIVLTIYVIAYHIPLWFEYVVLTYAGIYRKDFYLQKTTPVIRILPADYLNEDIAYQVIYKIILSAILRDLGPIILLIVFNIQLYKALKDMQKRYLKMRQGSNRQETRRHVSSSESMTRTIVIVVTTYTILTLPSLLLKLLTTGRQIALLSKTEQGAAAANTLSPLLYNFRYRSIANLLVSSASSANFIIYIVFAKKFKKIFLKTFCSCRVVKERFEDILTSGTSEPTNKVNNNMAMSPSKVGHADNPASKSARSLDPAAADGTSRY